MLVEESVTGGHIKFDLSDSVDSVVVVSHHGSSLKFLLDLLRVSNFVKGVSNWLLLEELDGGIQVEVNVAVDSLHGVEEGLVHVYALELPWPVGAEVLASSDLLEAGLSNEAVHESPEEDLNTLMTEVQLLMVLVIYKILNLVHFSALFLWEL